MYIPYKHGHIYNHYIHVQVNMYIIICNVALNTVVAKSAIKQLLF